MKDKQRVLLIQEACRLVNLLQRTRLQPDQFVARYRREIDRVMAPILPKPKKNKWHTWEELPSRRKAKIIKSLLRDGVTSVAQSDISRLRILPISYDQIRDIVSDRTKASRWHGIHRRAKMFPGWNTPWPDPLGTPATRIKAKRLKASRFNLQ